MGRWVLTQELARSPEWLTAVISGFYRDTLGRGPDPVGLAFWIQAAQVRHADRRHRGTVLRLGRVLPYRRPLGRPDVGPRAVPRPPAPRGRGRRRDATGRAWWVRGHRGGRRPRPSTSPPRPCRSASRRCTTRSSGGGADQSGLTLVARRGARAGRPRARLLDRRVAGVLRARLGPLPGQRVPGTVGRGRRHGDSGVVHDDRAGRGGARRRRRRVQLRLGADDHRPDPDARDVQHHDVPAATGRAAHPSTRSWSTAAAW